MRLEEPSALLPERPTPESWLAFVAVGLIGLFMLSGPFASGTTEPLPLVQGVSGAFIAGYAFTGAWLDAWRLDDAGVEL